jgi:hypothetical protein
MRLFSRWFRGLSIVFLAVCFLTKSAFGGMLITLQQNGPDIQTTFSGDLTGASFAFNPGSFGQNFLLESLAFGTYSNKFQLGTSNGMIANYNLSRLSGPADRWFANPTSIGDSNTYSLTGLTDFYLSDEFSFKILRINASHVLGTAITGSWLLENQSLSGLNPNYGDFVYQSGTATITLRILTGDAGAPVPEPTSMAIFGLGAIGFAYRNRRKLMK